MTDHGTAIRIADISADRAGNRDALQGFADRLTGEKDYFPVDLDRLLGARLLLAVWDGDRIVGVTGIEGSRLVPKGFTVLQQDHHGQGLARRLIDMRQGLVEERFDALFYIIHADNVRSRRLHERRGSFHVGHRWQLHYYATPYNLRGRVWIRLLWLAMPLVRALDALRSR